MPEKIIVNKKDRAKAVRMYASGVGIGAVASLLNVSGPVARRVLVEEGVALRGRGRPAKKAEKVKASSRSKKAAVTPVEVAETVAVAEDAEDVAE